MSSVSPNDAGGVEEKTPDSGGEGGEGYVVVTTTYPTTYGCYRGMQWSRADMIARSDREVSDETFETHSEAVREARAIRNSSEWYDGYCEPEPDSDDDDDDDGSDEDDDGYIFTNDDEPPYDSADIGNYDNDDEKLIEVMTEAENERRIEEDRAFLRREGARRHFQGKLRRGVLALRVREAGRVHYSTPPQPYDIPAELEVEEEKEGGVDASVGPPANSSSIKTLMYRGGRDGLNKFMKECCREDSDDEAEATDDDVNSNNFLRLLRACTSLEELHLKLGNCHGAISPAFVQKMLIAAPHLRTTLRVLSIGLVQIEPKALPCLGELEILERLDMYMSFSSEHWREDDFDCYGNEIESDLPYDEPLISCVASLERLRRLDLGMGDGESRRYLHDYMLSREALGDVSDILEDQNGEVTMDEENMPPDWPSEEHGKAARFHVLSKLASADDEEPEIQALAEEELKRCPTCCERASNRCTGCSRQWYCSVDCQRKDFKVHKKLCKIRFDEYNLNSLPALATGDT